MLQMFCQQKQILEMFGSVTSPAAVHAG